MFDVLLDIESAGLSFDIKMLQCKDSYYKEKTVSLLFYLYKENSYRAKNIFIFKRVPGP